MGTVTIERDMLGVIAYLSQNRQPYWLEDLFDTFSETGDFAPEQIPDFLAHQVMDCIPYKDRTLLIKFVNKRCELSKQEDRRFRDYGLIIGADGLLPRSVKEYCLLYTTVLDE